MIETTSNPLEWVEFYKKKTEDNKYWQGNG